MLPGPELGAVLASVEVGAVPDASLLEVLSAQSRQLAFQQAQVWAVMAEIGARDPMTVVPGARVLSPEQVFESAVEEIRAELVLTRRSARTELTHADQVAAVPRVAAALRAGRIDRRRAIVLADGVWDLTPEQVDALLDDVLPAAATVTATTL